MTRRSRGWIGAAAVALIVVLGVIWAFGLFEAETNLVAEDEPEQLRTEEGADPQGVVGYTSDGVTLPAETDDFIEGSTAASDAPGVAAPDGGVDVEGGGYVDPEDVVSPERGEVQEDTGIVIVEPIPGDQTDNTLREAD